MYALLHTEQISLGMLGYMSIWECVSELSEAAASSQQLGHQQIVRRSLGFALPEGVCVMPA